MAEVSKEGITITILGIIHRPVFYLRHDVSGDWILSPSSVGTEVGPIEKASLCLRTLAIPVTNL
jgi:hypothetical protein